MISTCIICQLWLDMPNFCEKAISALSVVIKAMITQDVQRLENQLLLPLSQKFQASSPPPVQYFCSALVITTIKL